MRFDDVPSSQDTKYYVLRVRKFPSESKIATREFKYVCSRRSHCQEEKETTYYDTRFESFYKPVPISTQSLANNPPSMTSSLPSTNLASSDAR